MTRALAEAPPVSVPGLRPLRPKTPPTGRDVQISGREVHPAAALDRGRPVPPTRTGARLAARPAAGSIREQPPVGRLTRTGLNLPLWYSGSLPFTPERFHVLLNSLFKVLFNFPSRYLFAIGLVVIFSLRWSLPPS